MSIFKDQTEFMQAAGQTTDVLNEAQMVLYFDLIQEEVRELRDVDSHIEAIKEAVDVLVVTAGLLLSMGIDADEAWRRVHASNMSKLTDGKLLKREDGKVLKGPNYQPPNLQDLIK